MVPARTWRRTSAVRPPGGSGVGVDEVGQAARDRRGVRRDGLPQRLPAGVGHPPLEDGLRGERVLGAGERDAAVGGQGRSRQHGVPVVVVDAQHLAHADARGGELLVDRPGRLVGDRRLVVVDHHDHVAHAVAPRGPEQGLDHVVDVVRVVGQVDAGVHAAPGGADAHHDDGPLGHEAHGERHEGGDVARGADPERGGARGGRGDGGEVVGFHAGDAAREHRPSTPRGRAACGQAGIRESCGRFVARDRTPGAPPAERGCGRMVP